MEAVMSVLAYLARCRRAVGPALPVVAVMALSFVTPAQSADVLYEQPYPQTYQQPYEAYRYGRPAPTYVPPPDYGPAPQVYVEREVVLPPRYGVPYDAYRRYDYRAPPYGSVYVDPYQRRYVEVERPPAPVVPPRRLRAYPHVVPEDEVVVAPPYGWRGGPRW
jgi:hypothetical protein